MIKIDLITNMQRKAKPVASGYANCIGPENPSNKVIDELGVQYYKLGHGNTTKNLHFDTKVLDRLKSKGVTVVIPLMQVWALWQQRNEKDWKYFVWEHTDDFKTAIAEEMGHLSSHLDKDQTLVQVWNEPNFWRGPTAHNVNWDDTKQVNKLKHKFWKGTLQNYEAMWSVAYDSLRGYRLIGPSFSGFYEKHLKGILNWMESKGVLPDYIDYHYPFDNLQSQLEAIRSWGYTRGIFTGEYFPPTGSHGEPGRLVHQLADITYNCIGGAIGPTKRWDKHGLKGMNGMIARRKTDRLTNIGYVMKLYAQMCKNAQLLEANTDGGNIKKLVTQSGDTIHALLGTYKEKPTDHELQLKNTKGVYRVTLIVIPNSTKDRQLKGSDITAGLWKIQSKGGSVTIDLSRWSKRNSAKYDACYIKIERVAM